ncbi:anti-sigma factor antagonist [Streptomyces sp. NPDC052023]|uniref:anti-sigma factor antagonist n=1 Tax=Streptomyces sp. NPDC052023 TaxID=3365681 RepID=UPI0037CE3ACF
MLSIEGNFQSEARSWDSPVPVGGEVEVERNTAPLTRHLRVHQVQGHTVMEFRGEIDIAAAAEILPHLDHLTGRPGVRIVIDLGPVEFFDCSGLRLLSRAHNRMLAHRERLTLVCADPMTLRVLRVTGLHRLLPPLPTLDAALRRPGTPTP